MEKPEQKKAHFIGICGVGMGATAQLLTSAGWTVTGSDDGFYPPMSEYLERAGISFNTSYAAEHIPACADVIVIGKNAKLIPDTNPEVKAAFNSGIRIASFPEIIGELVVEKQNVVVAGSYGKSTVTALIAHVLKEAGKDPSYFVGALPVDETLPAHIGHSNLSVIEGDEYPTGNDNPLSKFLYYHPTDVLITSAAHDHVNVFPTLDDYLAPFGELLKQASGIKIGCIDAPNVAELLMPYEGVKTYGLSENADWYSYDISYGEVSSFDLMHKEEKITTLETQLLGTHNVQNIVGASALLLEKELVTPEELKRGVKTFRGIKRRLDKKTQTSSVVVYEGFGSSYEKMRAGIEALHAHLPHRRKIVVFEPHTFSWRNRDALHWYDDVFAGADEIFVYEPATQGAGTHKQLSQKEIVERIQGAGFSAHAITNADDGLNQITKILKPNDVVLCSTSGDLGGIIPRITEYVERVFSI